MRYEFGPQLGHELRIRGLSITRLAELAGVSTATICSAIRGNRLNVKTAVRIAKAVATAEVVPELAAWESSTFTRQVVANATATEHTS